MNGSIHSVGLMNRIERARAVPKSVTNVAAMMVLPTSVEDSRRDLRGPQAPVEHQPAHGQCGAERDQEGQAAQ
jgi:hypothetical protein